MPTYVHLTLSPVDVFYHTTLCPVRRLLPSFLCLFVVFTIRFFVLMTFFTIQRLFCRPFVPFEVLSVDVLSVDVFYRRRFLLRHFVGESQTHSYYKQPVILVGAFRKNLVERTIFVYMTV
jgi:hypothetical protein